MHHYSCASRVWATDTTVNCLVGKSLRAIHRRQFLSGILPQECLRPISASRVPLLRRSSINSLQFVSPNKLTASNLLNPINSWKYSSFILSLWRSPRDIFNKIEDIPGLSEAIGVVDTVIEGFINPISDKVQQLIGIKTFDLVPDVDVYEFDDAQLEKLDTLPLEIEEAGKKIEEANNEKSC